MTPQRLAEIRKLLERYDNPSPDADRLDSIVHFAEAASVLIRELLAEVERLEKALETYHDPDPIGHGPMPARVRNIAVTPASRRRTVTSATVKSGR